MSEWVGGRDVLFERREGKNRRQEIIFGGVVEQRKPLSAPGLKAEISHIHPANLQSEAFSVGLGIPSPISFLLVVMT